METEFKKCPKCGEVGRRIGAKTENRKTKYDGNGEMLIYIMFCENCKKEWPVDYEFNPDPIENYDK